ncbi:MAG: hypothetical protein K2M06_08200 [Muribaculaceae bacterium]|nr:hypothetical protein [Muribaculaceae bacterium]
MDFGDISDIIVGLIVVGSGIWGIIIKPLMEGLKKQSKSGNLHPGQPKRRTAPRPATARRSAAEAHISEEAAFTPWAAEPTRARQPLAVETKPAPFISGEEGIRSTVDADAGAEAELAAINDSPIYASELLGSTQEDLRRGVIWAEILKPKYQD